MGGQPTRSMPPQEFTYQPDIWSEPNPEDMGVPKYQNLSENCRRFALRLTSDSIMERDVAARELALLNRVNDLSSAKKSVDAENSDAPSGPYGGVSAGMTWQGSTWGWIGLNAPL